MAFITEKKLEGCKYSYTLSPKVKKFTLKDTTFSQNNIGNFEFKRILEEVPNSGQGFLLKIIINPDLTGFKLSVTDKSGLRNVNIFKNASEIIQEKFYFQMDTFVDREIFIKNEKTPLKGVFYILISKVRNKKTSHLVRFFWKCIHFNNSLRIML